jgi:hypothetical protein
MDDTAAEASQVTADPGATPRPFRFYTSLVLQESTGLRTATLPTLAKMLRTVPESCVYHHTHHFLLQHHYLTPEPTNDFAYWVADVLGEKPLGELLASIDIMEFHTLADLREAFVGPIERHLTAHPQARFKFVSEGQEFFFMKAVHVVMPTSHTARTLAEFAQHLERVSIRSLYFHMFDARLRLGQPTNDFSRWIGEQLGLTELAQRIATLNPYIHTLDALRAILLGLVQQASKD